MGPDEYGDTIAILRGTNFHELELLCDTIENFPHGKDGFIERHWITNAIDCGSIETIIWMISKGVELQFDDDEGYTPLHSCIGRELPKKYEILEVLIKAGADINAQGTNDYTPLHLAAVNNDKKAMQILVSAGVDKTIRTRIDDRATAEEEERMLGCFEGADFLAKLKK